MARHARQSAVPMLHPGNSTWRRAFAVQGHCHCTTVRPSSPPPVGQASAARWPPLPPGSPIGVGTAAESCEQNRNRAPHWVCPHTSSRWCTVFSAGGTRHHSIVRITETGSEHPVHSEQVYRAKPAGDSQCCSGAGSGRRSATVCPDHHRSEQRGPRHRREHHRPEQRD